MKNHIIQIIQEAAARSGLPAEHVLSLSKSDNITLPRPRLEYEILPESYTRTGRKIALVRNGNQAQRKREVYEVRLDVGCHVLADDEAWLSAFSRVFPVALPTGATDPHGNWCKIRVAKATRTDEPAPRVGLKEIKVFTKIKTLFLVTVTWSLTIEETVDLIDSVTFTEPKYRR